MIYGNFIWIPSRLLPRSSCPFVRLTFIPMQRHSSRSSSLQIRPPFASARPRTWRSLSQAGAVRWEGGNGEKETCENPITPRNNCTSRGIARYAINNINAGGGERFGGDPPGGGGWWERGGRAKNSPKAPAIFTKKARQVDAVFLWAFWSGFEKGETENRDGTAARVDECKYWWFIDRIFGWQHLTERTWHAAWAFGGASHSCGSPPTPCAPPLQLEADLRVARGEKGNRFNSSTHCYHTTRTYKFHLLYFPIFFLFYNISVFRPLQMQFFASAITQCVGGGWA